MIPFQREFSSSKGNLVEVLREGHIVFLFPFWPLFRPTAWFAAFYSLICGEGRSAAAGLGSRPRVLIMRIELDPG
jgi:hypothetical protein